MEDFVNCLQDQFTQPVMGNLFDHRQYIPFDLSLQTSKIDKMSTINELFDEVEDRHKDNPGCLLYGGYMEHRGIYQSPLFTDDQTNPRLVHLGVDIWTSADTEIYAPLSGTVHSYQYNEAELDYGYTIILHHQIGDVEFYTLYGHLSDFNFELLNVGGKIGAGELFCKLGHPEQNGGWPPHLHFQVILDMQGFTGDFPGVVMAQEAEKYSHLCPDPTRLALGF